MHGFESNIYTAHAAVPVESQTTTLNTALPPTKMQYAFASLLSFSYFLSDTSSQTPAAYTACNNKKDISTQSQMFKASDSSGFIKCQQDRIAGLLPNGLLLEHK